MKRNVNRLHGNVGKMNEHGGPVAGMYLVCFGTASQSEVLVMIAQGRSAGRARSVEALLRSTTAMLQDSTVHSIFASNLSIVNQGLCSWTFALMQP